MSEEQRFEIERALDLLPHVAGASCAMVWFRIKEIKNPTREEFRDKVIEYFVKLESLLNSFDGDEMFDQIHSYIQNRLKNEIEQIKLGENKEIEKRYQRYIDYG